MYRKSTPASPMHSDHVPAFLLGETGKLAARELQPLQNTGLPYLIGREPNRLSLLRIDKYACRFDQPVCNDGVNTRTRRVIPDEPAPVIDHRASVSSPESLAREAFGSTSCVSFPVICVCFKAVQEIAIALSVYPSMTIATQSNQILLAVVTKVASRFDVMDLQIFRSSTRLAAPAIAAVRLPSRALDKLPAEGVFVPVLSGTDSTRHLNLLKNVLSLLG